MDFSWSTIYLIIDWGIRIGALIYVPQKRSPNATRAWLLFIFFFPIPAILLYAWIGLGRVYIPKTRLKLTLEAGQHISEVTRHLNLKHPDIYQPYQSQQQETQQAIDLITNLSQFPALSNNQIEVLFGYDLLIDRLLDDIAQAQKSIHMIYYIYADDEVAQRITDALCAAAIRGVEVRLLMDAFGSRQGIKHQAPQLRAAGVEVIEALPVELFRLKVARFDLRNHRKLAIIDGLIAHTGSQNITSPHFVTGLPNQELNLRIKGLAALELQAVFLVDYFTETQKVLPVEKQEELFNICPKLLENKQQVLQVIPGGLGYNSAVIRDVMISLIFAAKKEFCIVTPYFVPDESFLNALIIAAKKGIRVQLIFPKTSNHKITNLAQESYYTQLLEAGVEIYRYRSAMLHAKYSVFDDQVALVGSFNIDVRSFLLNAELTTAVYDREVIQELRGLQQEHIEQSEKIELADWKQRPPVKKVTANLARLADALL